MNARACPLCGARSEGVLYRQRFEPLSPGGLLDGYDVVACPRCGFAFADRIPDQAAFDAYYEAMSKYEYHSEEGRESAYDLARFEVMVDFMVPSLAGSECAILDVGCATGGLLDQLQRRGYGEICGLDPSPACAEAAARLYGVRVVTGTLSRHPDLGSKFGMIVLIGVLEHVADLRSALKRVRELLQPGGLIYVEVPDVLSFPEYDEPPFQEFSTEHVNFFSERSLGSLLRANGFVPERSEVTARPIAPALVAPVVYGVYRMVQESWLPEYESETRNALQRYAAVSEAAERRLAGDLERMLPAAGQFLVWGVGTLTQHLLATGVLPSERIAAFIDSNEHYQGRSLAGKPVLGPKAVRERREPLLVSSWTHREAIVHQIRNDLGCTNELLLLFDQN